MENAVALFGSFDENIKEIEKAYGVGILCRGTQIKISGEPEKVSLAGKAVQSLLSLISRGEELNDQNIHYVMDLVNEGNEEQAPGWFYIDEDMTVIEAHYGNYTADMPLADEALAKIK